MNEGINWSQIVGVAAAAMLTGGGASYTTHRFADDGEHKEIASLQREIDSIKQVQREESRENRRMIRELRRDIMTELRLAGVAVDSSLVEYYSIEPAASAMEAVEDIAEEVLEVEPE